jgi:hypothetical protein
MAQASKQASKEGAKRETQRASERASNNDDEGDGGENNTRGAFLGTCGLAPRLAPAKPSPKLGAKPLNPS